MYRLIDAVDPSIGLTGLIQETSPSVKKAEQAGKWTPRTKINLINHAGTKTFVSKVKNQHRVGLAHPNTPDAVPLDIQVLSANIEDYKDQPWPGLPAVSSLGVSS